jgi:hypothetical protein
VVGPKVSAIVAKRSRVSLAIGRCLDSAVTDRATRPAVTSRRRLFHRAQFGQSLNQDGFGLKSANLEMLHGVPEVPPN